MNNQRTRQGIVISIIIAMVLFSFVGCGSAAPTAPPMTQPTREALETAQAGDIQKLSATLAPTSPTANAPTVAATATAVPSLADQIDSAWGAGDWPQVIALLKRGNPIDVCKLYAAYFNYGQALLATGDKPGAVTQLQSAARMTGCGGEAGQALLALTPSPTPTRTSIPVPPTAIPAVAVATATPVPAAVATATSPAFSGVRTGAICNDGTYSSATGSGACSRHGGVRTWLYR